jgi:hypothetical protein
MNSGLENLRKWLIANKLSLNIVKTEYINGDSSYRLNFDLGKKKKPITTARKSMLKLVKLQSLVAKCCKMTKI